MYAPVVSRPVQRYLTFFYASGSGSVGFPFGKGAHMSRMEPRVLGRRSLLSREVTAIGTYGGRQQQAEFPSDGVFLFRLALIRVLSLRVG